MARPTATLLIISSLLLLDLDQQCWAWTPLSSSSSAPRETSSLSSSSLSRRDALTTAAKAAFGGANAAAFLAIPAAGAAEDATATPTATTEKQYRFEVRDRDMNKNAVIREDYWFSTGVAPPRQLNSPLVLDDPKWNAFGSCETSGGGSATNSCTYISLKQRQPAYSKYGFNINHGAKGFGYLRHALQDEHWKPAASFVFVNPDTRLPPPPLDALTKMVLLASSMLTSPNFSGISRELLVARFYVNEFKFALTEIQTAIERKDQPRALAAWDFGKDSFNSYTQVVNRQIVPKVGDPFPLIE